MVHTATRSRRVRHGCPTTSAATASSGTPTPTTTRPSTPTRSRRRRARGACGGSPSRGRRGRRRTRARRARARLWRRTMVDHAGRRRRARRRARPVAGQLRHARALRRRERRRPCPSLCASGEAIPLPRRLVRPRVLRPRRDVVLRSRALGRRGGPRCCAAVGAWCSRTPRRGRTSPGTSRQERVTRRLRRPYFGMRRFDDGDGRGHVDFQLPYGEWIRCFRRHGLVVDDLVELRAPKHASTTLRRLRPALGTAVAGGTDLGGPEGVSRAQHRVPACGTRRLTRYARHRGVDAPVALAERRVLLAVDDEQAAPVESPRQARACTSGVAGSRVVPITRIGGAPAAVTRPGGGSGGTGHTEHGRLLFTMNAPDAGRDRHGPCSSAVAAATSPTTGPSRQVTAQNASSAWSSRPSPSRPTNASANPQQRRRVAVLGRVRAASASSGHAGRPR